MNLSRSLLLMWVVATVACPFKVRSADGYVLMGELNCTACHLGTAKQTEWLSPKAAPRLTDLGKHASAEWLQRYLAAPHEALPGATMPDVLHRLPPAERAAAAEALTHHLLSVSRPAFRRVMPDLDSDARAYLHLAYLAFVIEHVARHAMFHVCRTPELWDSLRDHTRAGALWDGDASAAQALWTSRLELKPIMEAFDGERAKAWLGLKA